MWFRVQTNDSVTWTDSDKLRAHFLFRDVSMPFSKLGLSAPITDAVTALGYEKPTSIQQKRFQLCCVAAT